MEEILFDTHPNFVTILFTKCEMEEICNKLAAHSYPDGKIEQSVIHQRPIEREPSVEEYFQWLLFNKKRNIFLYIPC